MRRWIVLAAWCGMLLLVGGSGVLADAESVTVRSVTSADEFDLAAYRGRVVLLDFWASWCKPCKKSLPWMSDLQEEYADRGLRVVAINVDKDETAARSAMRALAPGIDVVLDPKGELAARYELEGMPSSFLIDREGQFVARHVGFLAADATAREAEVVALLDREAKEAKP